MSLFMRRRMLISQIETTPLLPSAYQQVEYIESTGTQYIDTYVVGTEKIRIELSMQLIGNQSAYNFFGARPVVIGNSDAIVIVSFSSAKKIGYFFNGVSISAIPYDNKIHNYELGNGIYKIDNMSYGDTIVNEFSTQYSLLLFASHDGETANCGSQRIYECKMYEDDVLIRNFIPCYRKSDSVIGMYDIVNGVFYTNRTLDTFLKGADV